MVIVVVAKRPSVLNEEARGSVAQSLVHLGQRQRNLADPIEFTLSHLRKDITQWVCLPTSSASPRDSACQIVLRPLGSPDSGSSSASSPEGKKLRLEKAR